MTMSKQTRAKRNREKLEQAGRALACQSGPSDKLLSSLFASGACVTDLESLFREAFAAGYATGFEAGRRDAKRELIGLKGDIP